MVSIIKRGEGMELRKRSSPAMIRKYQDTMKKLVKKRFKFVNVDALKDVLGQYDSRQYQAICTHN
jgi:hypothetical protein